MKKYLMVGYILICFGLLGLYLEPMFENVVLDKIIGGCGSGPCWSGDVNCGGIGGGMGTCALVGELCQGQCLSHCPAGSSHEFCAGWFWSCTDRVVSCSQTQKYKCCNPRYNPLNCVCEPFGFGADCTRADC